MRPAGDAVRSSDGLEVSDDSDRGVKTAGTAFSMRRRPEVLAHFIIGARERFREFDQAWL